MKVTPDKSSIQRIVYSHTDKDVRGDAMGVNLLLISVFNGVNKTTYRVGNIDEYIKQLLDFKQRWNLD
jgi:hypothetical protein